MEFSHQVDKNYNILLIEDDVDQAYLYKMVFDLEHLPLYVAANIETAISMIREKTPNVILLDFIYEESSGESVLQKLKSELADSDIPIVVFTNTVKKVAVEKFLSLGATHFWSEAGNSPTLLAEKMKEFLALTKKSP